MNLKEVSELRRRFRMDRNAISRIYGCFVNSSREIVSYIDESMGILPQDEAEKYLNLLKKALSGKLGKNLIDIIFSTEQVLLLDFKTLCLHFGHRTDSAVRSNPIDNIVGMLRSHVLSGRHSLYLFPIMERLADPLLAILVFTFLGQNRFLLPYGIWNRRRREAGAAGSFPEGYRP